MSVNMLFLTLTPTELFQLLRLPVCNLQNVILIAKIYDCFYIFEQNTASKHIISDNISVYNVMNDEIHATDYSKLLNRYTITKKYYIFGFV